MKEFSIVGKSIPRIDAAAKVTGKATFTDDMTLPGMLYGKILRSPLPHARIIQIDTTRAERFPGVKAVITGNNPICKKYTHWRIHPELADITPLATDKVRFVGEEVAAVAAIDKDTAIEALDLISVEYEELPGVFSIDEAMADGAPRVHDEYDRNINPKVNRSLAFGDIDQGFKDSDYIREDIFNTHTVIHGYMEPHSAIASFEPPGKLTLWATTGIPYYLQVDIAESLGLREGDVRVIKPHVGGNFGGRNLPYSLDFCSALLSMKTGRPVNITYDRKEEFLVGNRRHAVQMKLRTGVKKDGTLVAKQVTAYLDGGAYNGFGPTAVFLAGLYHTLAYKLPNFKYDGYRLYTNKPVSGAMRGFGGPQAHFAFESQMDMIAEDLGIDPVEIRLRNAIEPGYRIPGLASIGSAGLGECIHKVTESVNWKSKISSHSEEGIGIACYCHYSGANFNFFNTPYAYSAAEIKALPDGTVQLYTLAPDVGQGSDTVLCQILAEELGLDINEIRLMGTDTAIDPVDLGSYSSRLTLMAGNAVLDAAKNLKGQLYQVAAPILGIGVINELETTGGRIQLKNKPEISISFAEAVLATLRAKGGRAVIGRGSYTPVGKGIVSPAFGMGAAVAEVHIDKETGFVRVKRITVAHDSGKQINPLSVEGQVAGAIQMGVGYTLSEHLLQNNGYVLNGNFLDYKMPSSVDMPEIVSISVETIDPEGPYGAKEAGEGCIDPIAAAIANAVYNAIGYRTTELPITPDKVLQALHNRNYPPD